MKMPKRHWTKIRKKALAIMLVIAVVPLIVLGAVNIDAVQSISKSLLKYGEQWSKVVADNSTKMLTESIHDEMNQLANNKATLINERLLKIREQTALVANQATYMLAHPTEYSQRDIGTYVRIGQETNRATIESETALFGGIVDTQRNIEKVDSDMVLSCIGLSSGLFIGVNTASYPIADGFDCRNTLWYQSVQNKVATDGLSSTKDVILSELDEEKNKYIYCALPFYSPVLNDGEKEGEDPLFGVAASVATLDGIVKIINETKVGKTGYAYLSDAKNQPIIRSETSANEQVALNDKDYFIAKCPINISDWQLVIVVPRVEALASVTEMKVTTDNLSKTTELEMTKAIRKVIVLIVIVVFTTLFITVLLANAFARRITKPIFKLMKVVGDIAAGNLEARAEVTSNDEIGQLSEGVNAMTSKIKQNVQKLNRITAEKERINAELDIASRIQTNMLPSVSSILEQGLAIDVYASMLPAKEVGGDFYDFFFVNEGTLALVMADVSGKGVPAALVMVITKTLIKNTAKSGKSPAQVLEAVNRLLCENNELKMFVTCFIAYLDLKTGELICANAGHNPPLKTSDGAFEWIKIKHGLVLAAREQSTYDETPLQMNPGDMLCLYTDGVTEAMNTTGELWGNAAFLTSVNQHKGKSSEAFTLAVKNDLNDFVKGAEQTDDITMLVLKFKPDEQHRLTISTEIEQLDKVHDFITSQLSAWHISTQDIQKIHLICEEVLANIIAYSGSQTAELVLHQENDEITVTFIDSGIPHNPLKAIKPDLTQSIKERKQGGLGIYMVTKLADEVSYTHVDGKNRMSVKKILKK